MDNLLSARLQIDILRIQIACAAAKEYDAPWLEKSKSVMRDATGKFASKGSAIADDVKSTAKALKDATAISADVVGNLVKDKDFRHRAGLEPGLPGAKAIERVLAISKLSPGLEKKIDKWINEISQELADTYGEDGDALHQAIRKGGAPLPKNAGLKDKLEFAVARYKAYEDALKDPEKYAPTSREQTDLVGGAINSAVPIAVSMAITLTAEIALPLLTKGSIKWGHALTSAAVGVAVDLAVQKGLDAAEIENPAIRGIASLAAGMLAAGAVGAVGKKIAGGKAANIAKLETEKIRLIAREEKIIADNVSKILEEADEGVKEIWDKLGFKMPPILEFKTASHHLTAHGGHDHETFHVWNSQKKANISLTPQIHYSEKGKIPQLKSIPLHGIYNESVNRTSISVTKQSKRFLISMEMKTNRLDQQNRGIHEYISLVIGDSVEEEEFVRKLMIFASESVHNPAQSQSLLKGVIEDSSISDGERIVDNVKFNQLEFFGRLKRVVDNIHLKGNAPPGANEYIDMDNPAHNAELLIDKIKSHKLPESDGVLFVNAHSINQEVLDSIDPWIAVEPGADIFRAIRKVQSNAKYYEIAPKLLGLQGELGEARRKGDLVKVQEIRNKIFKITDYQP